MAWRYIAQRATTGEFLDWDLDLTVEELSWALSGSGALRATISPDVGRLRDADGRLVLEEWGTFIYAEADGLIRWGGVVILSDFDGEEWRLEAAGFATYPNGIPFLGEIVNLYAEPAQVVRDIWTHLQSFPDGNLGVEITGVASTGVRLGKDASPGWQEAKFDGVNWLRVDDANRASIIASADGELSADMTATDTAFTVGDVTSLQNIPLPSVVSVGAEDVIVGGRDGNTFTFVQRAANGTAATKHRVGANVKYVGTPTRDVTGDEEEPYELVWWEAKDSGQEIDDLAKTTPFDYVERHSWDGDVVRHEIALAYPRAGRRRDDLAFVQDVNISAVVAITSNGDDFANEVDGIGSGEGRGTLRRTVAERDGRLRRVSVFSDKSVSETARMDALIRNELAARRAALVIESVEVADHANARIGSWELGDDVLIDAVVPWLGRVQLWSRITGWALTGEHTARLDLARSDSFSYGG